MDLEPVQTCRNHLSESIFQTAVIYCSSHTDFMLRENKTSLEISNCCKKGKQSVLIPFLFHNYNYFLLKADISTNFKMCILPLLVIE